MSPSRWLPPLLLFAGLACSAGGRGGASAPAAGGSEPGLVVRMDSSELVLENRDTLPAYYAVFERGTAMLVNWRPCATPGQGCRSVPAGGTARLPLDSISGWTAESDSVTLYWYHLVQAAEGGARFDSVRSVQTGRARD
jgi:hypothetical protein